MSDESIRPDQPLPEDDAPQGFNQGGDPFSPGQNPEGFGQGEAGYGDPAPLDHGHVDDAYSAPGSYGHTDPVPFQADEPSAFHADEPVAFDAGDGPVDGDPSADSWLLEDGPAEDAPAGFAEVQALPNAFEGVISGGSEWAGEESWEDPSGAAPINEEDMVGASYVEPESTGSAVTRALVPGAIVLALAFGGVGAWALLDQGASLPTDDAPTEDLAVRTPGPEEDRTAGAELDSVEGVAEVPSGRVGFTHDGRAIPMGGTAEPDFDANAQPTVDAPREPGELAEPPAAEPAEVSTRATSDVPSSAPERPSFVAQPLDLSSAEGEAGDALASGEELFEGYSPEPSELEALEEALAAAARAVPRFDVLQVGVPGASGLTFNDEMTLATAEVDEVLTMERFDDPFAMGPLTLQFSQVGVPAGDPFVPFAFSRMDDSVVLPIEERLAPLTAGDLFANAESEPVEFVPFSFSFESDTSDGAVESTEVELVADSGVETVDSDETAAATADETVASIAPSSVEESTEVVAVDEDTAAAPSGAEADGPLASAGLFGTVAFEDVDAEAPVDEVEDVQELEAPAAEELADAGLEGADTGDPFAGEDVAQSEPPFGADWPFAAEPSFEIDPSFAAETFEGDAPTGVAELDEDTEVTEGTLNGEAAGFETVATVELDDETFATDGDVAQDDAFAGDTAGDDFPVGPVLVGPLFGDVQGPDSVESPAEAIVDEGAGAPEAELVAEAEQAQDDLPTVVAVEVPVEAETPEVDAPAGDAAETDALEFETADVPEPEVAALDAPAQETVAEEFEGDEFAAEEAEADPVAAGEPAAVAVLDEDEAHARLDAIFGSLEEPAVEDVEPPTVEVAETVDLPAMDDVEAPQPPSAEVLVAEGPEPTPAVAPDALEQGVTDVAEVTLPAVEETEPVQEPEQAVDSEPTTVAAVEPAAPSAPVEEPSAPVEEVVATVSEVVPSIVDPADKPRRASLLDRPGDSAIWPHRTVPKSKLKGDSFVLTPMVGNVRVVFDEGESLEGRLHGVGDGRVVVDTNIGRVTLDSGRAERIDRLGRLRARDVGERTSTRGLEKVRVRTAGGIFDGHLVARDGDRVTLLVGEGMRITIDASEVRPAGSAISASRIRRDRPRK